MADKIHTYMRNRQSLQHRIAVTDYLKELESDGYIVIDLQNKSPDGIAVKDNKIYAIEVLLDLNKNNRAKINRKKKEYFMFDDILFKVVERKPVDCDRQGWEK